MSTASDLMEIKEDLIREKYKAAENLLTAFDHTPRMAKNTIVEALEKSPGVGTRRRLDRRRQAWSQNQRLDPRVFASLIAFKMRMKKERPGMPL